MRRFERHRGFGSTCRAIGPRFGAYGGTAGGTLGFAQFAAFGIVLELLVVKKELFPGGKYEIVAAVAAVKNFVDEIHGLPPTDARLSMRSPSHMGMQIRVVLDLFEGVVAEGECDNAHLSNRVGAQPQQQMRLLTSLCLSRLRGGWQRQEHMYPARETIGYFYATGGAWPCVPNQALSAAGTAVETH